MGSGKGVEKAEEEGGETVVLGKEWFKYWARGSGLGGLPRLGGSTHKRSEYTESISHPSSRLSRAGGISQPLVLIQHRIFFLPMAYRHVPNLLTIFFCWCPRSN